MCFTAPWQKYSCASMILLKSYKFYAIYFAILFLFVSHRHQHNISAKFKFSANIWLHSAWGDRSMYTKKFLCTKRRAKSTTDLNPLTYWTISLRSPKNLAPFFMNLGGLSGASGSCCRNSLAILVIHGPCTGPTTDPSSSVAWQLETGPDTPSSTQ